MATALGGDVVAGGKLSADAERVAGRRWDLLVVGGGIVGAAVLHEAARRGLSALLLERDEFGCHTSANSLRIIHGGLRYLQRLDLKRHRRSVRERSRWLRDFPDLISPLPCLMPLSGHGLERPSVLRLAFAADHLLSLGRNRGLDEEHRLPRGRVLDSSATRRLCSLLDDRPMCGGALWWDAWIEDPRQLLLELLRRAISRGAMALDKVEAQELLVENDRVVGLTALHKTTRNNLALHAERVINAAGPWCRIVANRFDPANKPLHSRLFHPSLALNLLIDRSLGKSSELPALALSPTPRAPKLFFIPWQGRLLVGTHHVALSPKYGIPGSASFEEAIRQVLDRATGELLGSLRHALPSLEVDQDAILQVFWGLLPASSEGSVDLARRPVLLDHPRLGGPKGLVSISGIKLTTSLRLAFEALETVAQEPTKTTSHPQLPEEP